MNPYRFLRQLPDPDLGEVAGVGRLARRSDRRPRRGPGPARAAARAGPSRRARDRPPGDGRDRLHQHDPRRRGAALPGRRGPRAAHPPLHPVERGGDGGPGQPPPRRHRRPPGDLRVGRHPLRGRLQPLLPRQGRRRASATRCSSRATPRPASTPAPSSRAASARPTSTGSAARSGGGLPSYPHPRRSDFWEFPTVSMGLGLHQRRLPGPVQPLPRSIAASSTPAARRCGASPATARWTSPRAWPALALAGRERLDNLIFVVNCNLQRLDGPVRGNGKIIQELEGLFRGAGWNVIKVVWGREWDELLAARHRRRARRQDERHRRRRVPEVPGRVRRVHPRALLRPRPAAAPRWSSTSPTTTCAGCAAAATTPARSTPPTAPAVDHRGRAHRDPGQDGQGLGARPRLRGPQRHPPDEEDERGRAEDVPRPPRAPDPRCAPRPTSCRRTRTRASSPTSTST